MIRVQSLINLFKKNDVNFFSGVPDSVLKELSKFLDKNIAKHAISLKMQAEKLREQVSNIL